MYYTKRENSMKGICSRLSCNPMHLKFVLAFYPLENKLVIHPETINCRNSCQIYVMLHLCIH